MSQADDQRSPSLPAKSRDSSGVELGFLRELLAHRFGGPLPACDPAIDWQRFFACVTYHRAAPALGLDVCAILPASVQVELGQLRSRLAANSLRHDVELARVMAAARAKDLSLIALKGPAFAKLMAFDHCRPVRDLDLLVAPADQAKGCALLAELGYRLEGVDLNATEWRHDSSQILVELHQQFGDHAGQLPLADFDPFGHAVSVTLADTKVLTLDLGRALVFAAYHGGKHLWRRWFWLLDLCGALKNPAIDWPATMGLAKNVGAAKFLMLGLCLARDMFHAPIPPVLEPAIASVGQSPTYCRLLNLLAQRLPSDDQDARTAFGKLRFALWLIFMHDHWTARLATMRAFLIPSATDQAALRLPPTLHFLYPLVRLMRVLAQAMRAS
jgi:hypothetical protein